MSAAPLLARTATALYPPPIRTPRGERLRFGVAVPLALLLSVLQLVPGGGAAASAPLTVALSWVACAVAGVAVAHRRRWPLPVALVCLLCGFVSAGGAVFAVWAYVSLCTHRDWRTILPAAVLQAFLTPEGLSLNAAGQPAAVAGGDRVLNIAFLLGLTLFGVFVGSQRDAHRFAEERAASAERERELAVLGERNRIAREMHDVLAHRMSLVNLHANVLAYQPDAPAETRRTAGLIAENASASLAELRGVLSALRDPDQGAASPQPTLAMVPACIEEARQAGQAIDFAMDLDPTQAPDNVGRHVFRILQEALTNARKHSPGAPVRVRLSGSPHAGLHLRVSNPLDAGRTGLPGAQLGLVGAAERCHMLGGSFHAGPRDGSFTLTVHVPWSAP